MPAFNQKELDAKLYMNEHHPEVMQGYYAGLKKLKRISTRWFNNGEPESGAVGCFSKFMCISAPGVENMDNLFPNGYNI